MQRRFDRIGWQHVRVPPGLTHAQALAAYRGHPDVIAVEPNYVFQLRSHPVVPNDPRYVEQWALTRIGATNAWALSTGDSNVVVAVLDTGVRYTHEDLAANMWRNPGEVPGNGQDDDFNGYIDDVYGIDAVNDDSDPIDQPVGFTYHGTACASIIGAVGNNGLGLTGLNWPVRIMALRLAAASNFIASAWAMECFEYVVMMKTAGVNIRVTSNSWGLDDTPSVALEEALEAVGQAGILSVFAAGNASRNVDVQCDYPACFRLSATLNVAASDLSDNLASFSNYGSTNVDLAAPGVNITVADGISAAGYNPFFSGTSASCPYVAGAAALIASAYPFASTDQIKSALLQTVDVLPAFSGTTQSGGRLNVGRAMFAPVLSNNAPPFILGSPQSQIVGEGYPVTFEVRNTGAQPTDYYWRFNGQVFDRTAVPSITFESVDLGYEGEFSVVLSNAFGIAISQPAQLTVVIEPVILTEPTGLRVLDGSNVTFRVVAAGSYPLHYQWQRNGQDLPGATSAFIEFINANSTMTGDYRVLVSNAFNSTLSEVARLTVLTRPYIVQQPLSRTVPVGANVSLSATVTNAAALPIGYRWQRNRAPGSTLLLNEHSSTTNFLNIQTNVAGTWNVLVTSEAPTSLSLITSSNAYLTVVVPPTNQTVLVGTNVTLRAVAVGTTPITYQWQRAGTNIPNATASTLTLQNVTPSAAGTYSVIVFNALGQPTSFSASLAVQVPPPRLSRPTRMLDGSFHAVMEGLVVGQAYRVLTSADLVNWAALPPFTASGSTMPFDDPAASAATRRFYQLRWSGP